MQAAKSYHDTPRSWLIAVACCWTTFWACVINRCSGIFFVAVISNLDVSRREASWPFALIGTISQLTGPLWNVMLRFMPLRSVHILGSTLCALGILLCAVFQTMSGITVCLTMFTAIGQGLIFPSNMVVINTRFRTYRATASGLSYMGTTLIPFIFPPLIFFLLDTFGLRGTFLIVGGLAMNAIPGSLLISRPKDCETSPKRPEESKLSEETQEMCDRAANGGAVSRVKRVLHEELPFLKSPMYFVIVATTLALRYIVGIFMITVVDYADTKGLSRWEIAVLLSCQSGGDMTGRLLSGQLSDRKFCQRRDVMAVSFLAMSASVLGFVFSDSFVVLALSSLLLGLAAGSSMILVSVLYSEYFGVRLLPTAITCAGLINAGLDAPKSLLIGYYRDQGSSYSGLYTFLSAVGLLICLTWSAECLRQWILARRASNESTKDGA